VHSPSLLRKVGVEVPHEASELLGVLGRDQQMEVIGQEREGVKTQWIPLSSTSQNANHDTRQIAGGLE
jgi:hypothetical protein